MKKNNKFRNNNGNSNAYSLNYKFDSVSPAGKCSGTALDLIKRYNELAKEAHGSGDYIEMEVFRQYAEHYRKIVTEINERKTQHVEAVNMAPVQAAESPENSQENTDSSPITVKAAPENKPDNTTPPIQKTFKIIEVKPAEEAPAEQPVKPRRRRKTAQTNETAGTDETAAAV